MSNLPTIGVGFDAWGGIARVHTLALRSMPVLFPDLPFTVTLAGAATRNPVKNGPWLRSAGFAAVHESHEALVADPGVTAVDICTPNALHPAVAIAAWRAGKPVYCEKPLAESLTAARAMAEVWEGLNLAPGGAPPSQVAFVLRFWPAVARAKDLLAEGRLGRILSFRARMVHGGYLDPARPMSWRLDRALSGGGALADLGIHLIDLVQYLLGPVGNVHARARTFITERPDGAGGTARVEVDDWAEMTCELSGGAAGTIEATRGGDGQEETALEIFGTEGSLKIHSSDRIFPQRFHRASGAMHSRIGGQDMGPYTQAVLAVNPPARNSLGAQVDSHLASLHWWLRRIADPAWETGKPKIAAGIPEGLAAQQVLADAYRSAGMAMD